MGERSRSYGRANHIDTRAQTCGSELVSANISPRSGCKRGWSWGEWLIREGAHQRTCCNRTQHTTLCRFMFPNHLLPARLPHTAARLVCQTSHTYNSIITAMTSRPRHSRIQQRRPSATQVRNDGREGN
jgi:hypothetical protein